MHINGRLSNAVSAGVGQHTQVWKTLRDHCKMNGFLDLLFIGIRLSKMNIVVLFY